MTAQDSKKIFAADFKSNRSDGSFLAGLLNEAATSFTHFLFLGLDIF